MCPRQIGAFHHFRRTNELQPLRFPRSSTLCFCLPVRSLRTSLFVLRLASSPFPMVQLQPYVNTFQSLRSNLDPVRSHHPRPCVLPRAPLNCSSWKCLRFLQSTLCEFCPCTLFRFSASALILTLHFASCELRVVLITFPNCWNDSFNDYVAPQAAPLFVARKLFNRLTSERSLLDFTQHWKPRPGSADPYTCGLF